MCKRLLLSLLILVLVTSTAVATTWFGSGGDADWTNGANWDTGVPPTSGDWTDIRNDSWVGPYPVLTAGQTANAWVVRMNPGFDSVSPQTTTITMDGGTLNLQQEIYIGDSGLGGGDFIMNSGQVNVGLRKDPNNMFTAVGSEGGTGRLFINGGTFNAGTLGLPKWWSTVGTGNVFIDGGNLNTEGIIIDLLGGSPTSGIEFTENLANGGGLLTDTQDLADPQDWENWQAQVGGWIGSGIISTSTGGTVQAEFSSVGTVRTSEIFSVPEPMTMNMAFFAIGGLLLRRRR